jgi:hypothetical protein
LKQEKSKGADDTEVSRVLVKSFPSPGSDQTVVVPEPNGPAAPEGALMYRTQRSAPLEGGPGLVNQQPDTSRGGSELPGPKGGPGACALAREDREVLMMPESKGAGVKLLRPAYTRRWSWTPEPSSSTTRRRS